MSIANAFVAGDVALVLTDSELVGAVAPDVRTVATKMAVLTHGPAVIAARGHAQVAVAMFASTMLIDLSDLDAAAQIFGPHFARIWKAFPANAARVGDPTPILDTEIALAAWCRKNRRFRLWRFALKAGAEGCETTELADRFLAPGAPPEIERMTPNTVESMLAVAHLQHRAIRRLCPDAAGGGQLILARLTPEGISIGRMGELPRLDFIEPPAGGIVP